MKVLCKQNKITNISNNKIKKYLDIYHYDEDLDLEIGKEYNVYGLLYCKYKPTYYIRADENQVSPYQYSSHLFDVIDNRPSCHWKYFHETNDDDYTSMTMVIPEWGQIPTFYESLIDGCEEEEEIFLKYIELMDAEFAD